MFSYRRLTGCNLPIPNEPILGREYTYKKQKALTSCTLRGAAHGHRHGSGRNAVFLDLHPASQEADMWRSRSHLSSYLREPSSFLAYLFALVEHWKYNYVGLICVRIPVPRSICLYIHTFYSLHTFTQFLRRRGNPKLNQPLQKYLNYFVTSLKPVIGEILPVTILFSCVIFARQVLGYDTIVCRVL